MTVTQKLFKILGGHDVAIGRTDRQTDGRTDGRTPYHNTSEVSLRAYKNQSTFDGGPVSVSDPEFDCRWWGMGWQGWRFFFLMGD